MSGTPRHQCSLAGGEHGGLEQGSVNLLEYEGIELVGAYAMFGAVPAGARGAKRVVVGAGVVADEASGAASGTVGDEVHVAGAAADETTQQPGAWL